ncbi:uncharacterized protein LOC129737295 [Falco cherrug]|uniref:uncharacterized protein LOC129737295 n=1 Tax=Falco cherrug TaxID=345164 RepID=UPI00247A1621|nr:uncharacterized protein LOC129737295 [Falco cherrug]
MVSKRSCREALSDAEPVLSADVRLTRGRKRSERRLLLLHEELVVAKLRHGTSLRPQLRLALDQLWVLSSGKEAAGQDGQEEEEGTDEDSTSVILAWPTGSCIATFGREGQMQLLRQDRATQGLDSASVPMTNGLSPTESGWTHLQLGQRRPRLQMQGDFAARQVSLGKQGNHLQWIELCSLVPSVTMQVGQPTGGCHLDGQGQLLGSACWMCFCGDTENSAAARSLQEGRAKAGTG